MSKVDLARNSHQPTAAGAHLPESMAVVITENMAKKAGEKELARMLAELESVSDEEAQQRLADESK